MTKYLLVINLTLMIGISGVLLNSYFNRKSNIEHFEYDMQSGLEIPGLTSTENIFFIGSDHSSLERTYLLIGNGSAELPHAPSPITNGTSGGNYQVALVLQVDDNGTLNYDTGYLLVDLQQDIRILDSQWQDGIYSVLWQNTTSLEVHVSWLNTETMVANSLLLGIISLSTNLHWNLLMRWENSTLQNIYTSTWDTQYWIMTQFDSNGAQHLQKTFVTPSQVITSAYHGESDALLFVINPANSTSIANFTIPQSNPGDLLFQVTPELDLISYEQLGFHAFNSSAQLLSHGDTIYLAGETNESSFPYHLSYPSGDNRALLDHQGHGSSDLFVLKYQLEENVPMEFLWGRSIVGSAADLFRGMHITESNNLILQTLTNSLNFPMVSSYFPVPYTTLPDNFSSSMLMLDPDGYIVYGSYSPFTETTPMFCSFQLDKLTYFMFSQSNSSLYTSQSPEPLADFDKDLVPNGFEIQAGANPLDNTDYENDGDHDRLPNNLEYIYHTRPDWKDTDLDGILDGREAGKTNPLIDDVHGSEDADGDSVPNGVEYQLGMNPGKPDSDYDGIPDNVELQRGTDPTDSTDSSMIKWYVLVFIIVIGSFAGLAVFLRKQSIRKIKD